MDPFSSEGELLNVHNAFHQGQYSTVLDQSISTLSPENKITAQVYIYRARIACGEAAAVIQELGGVSEPDLQATKAFAEYTTGKSQQSVAAIDELVSNSSENSTVQILGAIVLHLDGRSDEALTLLSKHQGNLEAVALITQIRLAQNRIDLALKEVQSAKKWAQDSLLVNLAESWVGLRVGGDKYQQAYYVYEELAQAPTSSSSRTLVGQAVAELHLGRLPEAEVALKQALERNPNDTEALANSVLLSILTGDEPSQYLRTLEKIAPEHTFMADFQLKNDLFDRAASKYSAKASS
ncbi:coatomer epsilon subunit-domain-containing protein [Geopyxis carbonaria]|nr:coatomer epsilon subunit-domain-containing protein [Geopyxis carbonaria]